MQGLYPNLCRELIKASLFNALEKCTNYTKEVSQVLIDLTMFCLENIVVQNGNTFYTQSKGIITGDNNSVSIANIALHHVILPIATTVKTSKLFRRYIDDIVFLSETKETTDHIKNQLKCAFKNHKLNLIFREISTEGDGNQLEFLDVNHVINKNEKGGFYVKNYIKPTAKNRVFVNGRSHHPRSIYKSIVFSESIRLRRLCERDCDYLEALKSLKDKCLKSCFCKALVEDMLKITEEWKDRFGPPVRKTRKTNENINVWATNFPQLLKLSKKEKQLSPNAMVTFKRPQTLSTLITNYKALAHKVSVEEGFSHPCGKCLLCDRGREAGMVEKTNLIKIKHGKSIKLKKQLTCKNSGVYAAKCSECDEYYVGQTITSFSQRWNSHRFCWKSTTTSETNDRAALKLHYAHKHPKSKKDFKNAYSVVFVDTAANHADLDFLESRWIGCLQANININKTILPLYR